MYNVMWSIAYLRSFVELYWSKINLFTKKVVNFIYSNIDFNNDYENDLIHKYNYIFSTQKHDWDCGLACLEMVKHI